MPDNSSLMDDPQFYSELLRAYFDSTRDAIFVLCDEMKFLTCNKTTEHWLGISENELTRHNHRTPIVRLLGDHYDAEKFGVFFNSAIKGKSASFETLIRPLQGKDRWIDISMSRVDIENGDMVIAVARDISERKKHLAMIKKQSRYDELTGLPNRKYIIEYLKKYQNNLNKASHELVLLVLDLDRFKEVNESLGHKAGDLILQEIARRLSRVTDISSGEVVARLSGDEFAIAFPGIELSQSRITAQMIRQIVSQPFAVAGRKISLNCAIGVAALPTHTNDSSKLIQLAEVAMYNAKSHKLGISTYDPRLSGSVSERLHLATDLCESLKKSHIKAFFQPIINMRTKSLHAEVLARWQHPQRGNIVPDIFIPLAEETGSINKLTSKIMESALRACAPLFHEHVLESVSVNISPYCLSNEKLPTEIETYLEKYDIQASSLTLEITESVMMSNLPSTQKNIEALHKLGLAFSIDDFGTGYSSLSKLKYMQLKELKIDKSFILNIDQHENDSAITNAAITNAMIKMAHALGLEVVAEGIENEEIWSRLSDIDCDYGQGYWIAKPMSANKFISWVKNYHELIKSSSGIS